jgi:hypothetical protein
VSWTTRRCWLVTLAVSIGLLTVAPGCSPAPDGKDGKTKTQPQSGEKTGKPGGEAAKAPEKSAKTKEEPAKTQEPRKTREEPAKTNDLTAKPDEIPARADDKPVKISSFAPAEELVTQADKYMKQINGAVESGDAYKDDEGRIKKNANTLAVIALALGLHDEDNKYKASASALVKAARAVAAAKDFDSSKTAVEALRMAAEGNGPPGGELKWEPVAPLLDLVQELNVLYTSMSQNVKPERLKTRAKISQGQTTLIAAILWGIEPDTQKAKNAAEAAKWKAFSIDCRNAAAALHAAIRAGNEKAADEGNIRLNKSCEECHTIFPKAEPKKP